MRRHRPEARIAGRTRKTSFMFVKIRHQDTLTITNITKSLACFFLLSDFDFDNVHIQGVSIVQKVGGTGATSAKMAHRLPSLAGLSLQATTKELVAIDKDILDDYWKDVPKEEREAYEDDEEKELEYRRIPDPFTLDGLPFFKRDGAFRIEIDRGRFAYYDPKKLIEYVHRQKKEGKRQIVEPSVRQEISKRDLAELKAFAIQEGLPFEAHEELAYEEEEEVVEEEVVEEEEEEEVEEDEDSSGSDWDDEFTEHEDEEELAEDYDPSPLPAYTANPWGWPMMPTTFMDYFDRMYRFPLRVQAQSFENAWVPALINPMGVSTSADENRIFDTSSWREMQRLRQRYNTLFETFRLAMVQHQTDQDHRTRALHPLLCGEGQSPSALAYAIYYHPDTSLLETMISDRGNPNLPEEQKYDFTRRVVQQRPILPLTGPEYTRALRNVQDYSQFPKSFNVILLACDRVRNELQFQSTSDAWPWRSREALRVAENALRLLLQNQPMLGIDVNRSRMDSGDLLCSPHRATTPTRLFRRGNVATSDRLSPFNVLYGDVGFVNECWYATEHILSNYQWGYFSSVADRPSSPSPRTFSKYSERSMDILLANGYVPDVTDLSAVARNFDSYLLLKIENASIRLDEQARVQLRRIYLDMMASFDRLVEFQDGVTDLRRQNIPIDVTEFLFVLVGTKWWRPDELISFCEYELYLYTLFNLGNTVLRRLATFEGTFEFAPGTTGSVYPVPVWSTKRAQYEARYAKRYAASADVRAQFPTVLSMYQHDMQSLRRSMEALKTEAENTFLRRNDRPITVRMHFGLDAATAGSS